MLKKTEVIDLKTTSKIKFELWVLNLILFSCIFVGCGIPANESVVPEQPPELQVIYQTNESELSYDIKNIMRISQRGNYCFATCESAAKMCFLLVYLSREDVRSTFLFLILNRSFRNEK